MKGVNLSLQLEIVPMFYYQRLYARIMKSLSVGIIT